MVAAQRSGRSRYRLILLGLTAITLLTLDFRSFGPLDQAQQTVRDVAEPVVGLAGTILSPIGNAWNAIFDFGDLEAENETLRERNAELEGAIIQADADTDALKRVLEASDITYVGDIPRVTASVVRRAVGNFDSDVVTIDKGSNDGLRSGLAAVTGAGFVGKVDRVDATTATVILSSDPSLTVGLRIIGFDYLGLGHAVSGDPTLMVIDQGIEWPSDNDQSKLVTEGSVVVTDAASRYPAEIPIGTVVRVQRGGTDGASQEILVKLAADSQGLDFLSVLLEGGSQTDLDVGPEDLPSAPPAEPEAGTGDGGGG